MKKSSSRKISERYVDALFDVAQQENAVSTIEKNLSELSVLMKENSDFCDFLHNPLLTREAQGDIATTLLKKSGAHALTIKFLALLAHNKRLDILSEIIEIFLEKAATSRGELTAELVAARAVTSNETAAIADSLGKAYDKKINLTVQQNPDLLGGAIINIGSIRLDSSLAGKLNRLKQELETAS